MQKYKNSLLITGSHGLIGRIIRSEFGKFNYEIILIDKENPFNPINILKEDINNYFINVENVIHLAANPSPFIAKEVADKNVEITKRVIEVCKNSGEIKRIINASSINVYPYRDIERITKKTPLEANTAFNYGHYGKAKIECESLFEEYCRKNGIFLLNLRLGWVTWNDKHPPSAGIKPHDKDLEVALKHKDLRKIIRKAINYEGIGSYVCVSKRGGFVADSLIFPFD